MAKDSDFVFDSGEAGGLSPSFSDVSFQNERAMWWAEFDSVGEEAVRAYVERKAYTPTGMEVARQWLARQEFLQLREDVKAIRTLAEVAQETASESRTSASEALTLASAVTAKKNARTMAIVGTIASLFALCAIVMVLASSRQVTTNTKQASAQPSRPNQAVVRSMPPAVPPAETQQASAIPPENVRKEQPSNALQIKSAGLKPEGQSLRESLALIADKVAGEGTVNFTAQFRDMATGRDQYDQRLYKASNVTIDPNRCQVRYHWHVEQGGGPVSDQDRTVDLRLAKGIRVTSIDGESGRRFFVRAYPKVYVVHIARRDSASGHNFYFYNKDMAARVVTAARRAVELCGKRESRFRGR